MRPLLSMLLFVVVWALCEHSFGASPAGPPVTRRVLHNLDGDSCLTTCAGGTEPVESGRDHLFVATPLTAPGSFTKGIEGPACDAEGNIYAV
ncbi:MAG: hypothetical protein L0Z07_10465, partial [Planctomycetes bacterium]|nr:hypothetical protein [Planctomycetota bacterium]